MKIAWEGLPENAVVLFLEQDKETFRKKMLAGHERRFLPRSRSALTGKTYLLNQPLMRHTKKRREDLQNTHWTSDKQNSFKNPT